MTLSGRFFLPGPVEVDPEVSEAMLRPMMNHRGRAARELLAGIQPGLQALFGTTRPVMLVTGSATAMLEAGVRAAVRDRALCIVSGLFGERLARIVEQCGREAVRLHVPRGAVLESAQLEQMLDGLEFDTVTMVHCETSTGALAPVAELVARLRRLDDVVTLVDAVSSVGGMRIPADQWDADFVATGSQKALGLPPGLAFAIASSRLLARAAEGDAPGSYLNLTELHHAAEESRFPRTPALPVVYALERQLERIGREGLPARFARHRAMRERIEAWVGTGVAADIWAPPGRRSETVTALLLRPSLSARAIADELASDGWQLATGLLEDQDRILRIGHMGDMTPAQVDSLLDRLTPKLKGHAQTL